MNKFIFIIIILMKLYKIGIFDSGYSMAFNNSEIEIVNFTDDLNNNDYLNHGTYTINILKGDFKECPGYNIKNKIIMLKIFNKWYKTNNENILKALKYIDKNNIKIIGLPFSYYKLDIKNKNYINNLITKGFVFIAASGNEGPSFGSLSIPGNMQKIITLGSSNYLNNKISNFSSNGPSQYNLKQIIFKPDFWINGEGYYRSNNNCEKRKGTTISVIKGLYYISKILAYEKNINQSIIYSYFLSNSSKINNSSSIFKQGNGIINSLFDKKLDFENIYINPNYIDLTKTKLFPYNTQPLFYGINKFIISTKVLSNYNIEINYLKHKIHVFPLFLKKYIKIKIKIKKKFKYIGIIKTSIKLKKYINRFLINKTKIKIKIIMDFKYFHEIYTKNIIIKFYIIKRPKEIYLFDMYHNKNWTKSDVYNSYVKYDFKGDNLYTNFTRLLKIFNKNKVYFEINYKPLSCILKDKYKGIIIIDPEKKFDNFEINNIVKLFKNGLNWMIVSDFFDINENKDNNISNLNYLLSYFNIELGYNSFSGETNYNSKKISFTSSSYIKNFPSIGLIKNVKLTNETTSNKIIFKSSNLPVFGLINYKQVNNNFGKISILTDSSCLETKKFNCSDFIDDSFKFFNNNFNSKEWISYSVLKKNFFLNDYSMYSIEKNYNNICLNIGSKLIKPIYFEEKKTNYLVYIILYVIIIFLFVIVLIFILKKKIKVYLLKKKLTKIPNYSIVYI